MKNVNTELTERETPLFLQYCNAIGVRYETSGAYNLRHIELLNVTPQQETSLEIFLARLKELERDIRCKTKAGK